MEQGKTLHSTDLVRRLDTNSTVLIGGPDVTLPNDTHFKMEEFLSKGQEDLAVKIQSALMSLGPDQRKVHRGLELTFLTDESTIDAFRQIKSVTDPRRNSRPSVGNISIINSKAESTQQQLHSHDTSSEVSKYLSGLYAMLIIIAGSSLSLAAFLTNKVNVVIIRWFDVGMMNIAITWMLFAFIYLFRQSSTVQKSHPITHFSLRFVPSDINSGSFYLKIGATIFAIGTMLFGCLQIASFIQNNACSNPVFVIHPCLFIIFVILQLYFVFKNSQFKITKFRAFSRFGLMHMIAIDIVIWVRTLLDETMHEFVLNRKILDKKLELNSSETLDNSTLGQSIQPASLSDPVCGDKNTFLHQMMESAAMFLFPCTIEYTLITAGILYIMWQVVGVSKIKEKDVGRLFFKQAKLFSVDCTNAANGLFAALVVVVVTIVGMIVFYIFLNDDDDDNDIFSGFVAFGMDLGLNVIGVVCVTYCAIQFTKNLHKVEIHNANVELDDGLLLLTMFGVYSFIMISFMGAMNRLDGLGMLTLANCCVELMQTTLQTVFILDAGKRVMLHGEEQNNVPGNRTKTQKTRKPAREMLTLLLGVNFCEWALDIFCMMRPDSNPNTRDYFGVNQYTVMLHVVVPLVIFYRFHSTVCLFEIWKRAYKVPHPEHPKPQSRKSSMAPRIANGHPAARN